MSKGSDFPANLNDVAKRFGDYVEQLPHRQPDKTFDALYPLLEKARLRGMSYQDISNWLRDNAGIKRSAITIQRHLLRRRKVSLQRRATKEKLKSAQSKLGPSPHKFNRIKDSEL